MSQHFTLPACLTKSRYVIRTKTMFNIDTATGIPTVDVFGTKSTTLVLIPQLLFQEHSRHNYCPHVHK